MNPCAAAVAGGLVGVPVTAAAQGFISPSVGFNFGGDVTACESIGACEVRRAGYGVGIGYLGTLFGFEEEIVYTPTFFGHSVGHWEGDTLVVDTVGFNERFWFARRPMGMVHTEALHLIERFSRPDYDTLHYEVTVDDPKAYTRPWTASWDVPWTEYEIVEYLCTENNRDPVHFVGPDLP